MQRRRFVKAAAGTALAGLAAGCSSDDGGGAAEDPSDMNGTESPGTGMGDQTETDMGDETDDGTGTDTEVSGEVDEVVDGIEVTNHELYEESGEVGLQGTVQNTGDNAFEYVQAEVTLHDDQGEILWEFIDESETESEPRLEAGNEWQFDVVFEEAQMSEVASYTIDVDGFMVHDDDWGDITGEIDDQDDNLEILSTHLTRQESETFVAGDVKNVGEDDVENIEVDVTLFDEEDAELFDFSNTVEQEDGRQILAPGGIWDFRVVFDDIDMQEVARYTVTANSELV